MKNIFRKFRLIGTQLVTMSFPPEEPYGTSSDEKLDIQHGTSLQRAENYGV